MLSIVSIDIETTGLDLQADSILEIGAVRFSGKRVEDEWSRLINPGRPIPPFITQLTGITNEMVRNAPPIKAVIRELADFVGSSPVLGHNIRFDLSFLQRQKILAQNEILDTYELAAVLLPTAGRYNLGSLVQQLKLLLPATHRALDDAQATLGVYLKLNELLEQLPIELLAEFTRLSERLSWDASWTIQQALREKARQPIGPKKTKSHDFGVLFSKNEIQTGAALVPVDPPVNLDANEIASFLDSQGPFQKFFKNYEHRPQQIEMAREISKALVEGKHEMVEAGTGIGKSFAYLVPAAVWATRNNSRVIISTNTINLQDQLIKKDIPDLRTALGLDLRATVLKGRSNYLCPRRLQILRQRGPETIEEMRVLAKVLVWLQTSDSGDRTEINLNGPVERDVWSRISSEDEGCRAEVCMSRTGGVCPFYRSRQFAQNSHLIVVNHALLLSDVASGSHVLPEYQHLIVDEAHHIEAATTSALSVRISQTDLIRLIREIGGISSGVLGRLFSSLRGNLKPSDLAAVEQLIQKATDLSFQLDRLFQGFFQAVDEFLAELRENQPISPYGQQARILPATRTLPVWTDVEIAWDQAQLCLRNLTEMLMKLNRSATDQEVPEKDDLDDALGNLATINRRLTEVETNLTAWVNEPDFNSIYWAEIQPNSNRLSIQIAPLNIGPLMEQYLWHEKSSVILTSATLTAHGEFDYLRNRLNADEAEELALGSPFDFETAAMLYLVNDIPEPSDANGYQRAVEHSLVNLAKATLGRMLVLFTSYAQLKRTSIAISQRLAEQGILVYEQGEGASPNTLLESFRETEKAVLLGTRSFWEGVDIPGEKLSALVIAKLPFDVPSDPIVAARSETFEDPFNEYSLPEAILRFRQGFGRLIRTQSDRGIVVVLDRRILTKKYGKLFRESLPPCEVREGSMHDLPGQAARWLNF